MTHQIQTSRTLGFTALILLLGLSCSPFAAAHDEWGSFNSNPKVELLTQDSGREIKLLEDFAYTGPDGVTWIAPVNSIVNGASVPRIAWRFAPPLTGLYRDASIIHDVGCDEGKRLGKRSWESTHRAFYTAMRARGVNSIKAKIMYAAVYHFGPRWDIKKKEKDLTPEQASEIVETIRKESPASDIEEDIQISESSRANDKRVNLKIQARAPEITLTEADFEKLQAEINESAVQATGEMSVDDIENWKPTH